MPDRGGAQRPLGLVRGTVELQEYDSRWPEQFERVRARLSAILPGARIEHIGSTSVPGCVAKPILDVSVGLPPGQTLHVDDARTAGLEFRIFRDGTAMFALVVEGQRHLAHVHVRERGSEAELRDLRFRDFLRAHPEEVRRYSREKRRILPTARDRAAYATAKEPFVTALQGRARTWAQVTKWSPR